MQKSLNKIDIIDFTEESKDAIKVLNYEWLEKHFKVERGDEISLSNPQEEIIVKGGFVFYALLDNEIVGTASLLKKTETIFELSKMAVTEKSQGLGIGKLLIDHCIRVAKDKNIEKLILYSNTKLTSAIHLYRKYGFVEIELEANVYDRADIKMEMQL